MTEEQSAAIQYIRSAARSAHYDLRVRAPDADRVQTLLKTLATIEHAAATVLARDVPDAARHPERVE